MTIPKILAKTMSDAFHLAGSLILNNKLVQNSDAVIICVYAYIYMHIYV